MHKYFWPIFIVFVFVVGVYFFMNKNKKTASIVIDGKKFNVEIAKTSAEREKGLMNRSSLDADSGMLFVFPSSDIYPFWMKNTLIPLDIIYINDSKIIEMTTLNPPIDSNIPQYSPKNKANYVLELPAGTASKYNFAPGDSVEINL